MSILIENLKFSYAGTTSFGFKIPSLALATGQSYLLLGPSGSGKSTLLNLLAGILRPHSGRLQIAGQELADVSASEMDRFRGDHIGFIFQTFNLIPWLNVRDNIALGLAFAPERRARLREPSTDTIMALTRQMNIEDALLKARVGELSIGQQQRVAAARALIGAPDIILADEPTSALDDANSQLFCESLMRGLDPARQTLLVVSHDTRLRSYFDHVLMVTDIIQSEHPIGAAS